jgi:hypothetical protein
MHQHQLPIAVILLLLTPTTPANPPMPHNPSNITVEWDDNTLRHLAPGLYPRMIRLRDNTILFSAEHAGKSLVRRSTDDGRSWSDPVTAATFPHGAAANPELLALDNGDILLFYNQRPNDGQHPYAIALSRSTDAGRTWTQSDHPIYSAGTAFDNGCWEPAAVQLPSGEILLFFADEGPYTDSHEQQITLIRSTDRGHTWLDPQPFSFRPRGRDGMPVPLLLANGSLAIAIEDNMLTDNFMFKPVILTADPDTLIHHQSIGPEDPRRHPAAPDIPPQVSAGAPYLRQLPTGPTLLSCQSNENRHALQMTVYIGDANAHNFTTPTTPFDLPQDTRSLWSSLFIKDETTITALTSTTIDGQAGVWAIDAQIRPAD